MRKLGNCNYLQILRTLALPSGLLLGLHPAYYPFPPQPPLTTVALGPQSLWKSHEDPLCHPAGHSGSPRARARAQGGGHSCYRQDLHLNPVHPNVSPHPQLNALVSLPVNVGPVTVSILKVGRPWVVQPRAVTSVRSPHTEIRSGLCRGFHQHIWGHRADT